MIELTTMQWIFAGIGWYLLGLIGCGVCNYVDWKDGHDFTTEGLIMTIILSFLGLVMFIFGIVYYLFNTCYNYLYERTSGIIILTKDGKEKSND